MAQSHDMHNESHYEQFPPNSMPNQYYHNIINHINLLNKNYNSCVKRGSTTDMVNIQGGKTNAIGKNDDL